MSQSESLNRKRRFGPVFLQHLIFGLGLILFGWTVAAQSHDGAVGDIAGGDLASKLLAGMEDEQVRQIGRSIYDQACVACHGRALEGGNGPKLTDSEWLHGESPEEVLKSVKQGFLQKGMPGFAGVYTEDQLKAVTSYVLSQRAGWSNVGYAIRRIDGLAPEDFDYTDVDGLPLLGSGAFHTARANLGVAEMPFYVLVIEGELNVPYGKPVMLYANGRNTLRLMVQIDDQAPEFGRRGGGRRYDIAAGTHKVRMVYAARENGRANGRDLPIVLVDPSRENYYAGLTDAGHSFVESTIFQLLAETSPVVSMRRIDGLGGAPMSVGLPEGVNFAFDTRTCAVTGAWIGEFLDIGPNVTGNANNPARILGDWLFNAPNAISLSSQSGGQKCRYRGSELAADGTFSPKILFDLDGMDTELTASSGPAGLMLVYRFRNASGEAISLDLPEDLVGRVFASDGTPIARSKTIRPTSDDFSLELSVQ